MASSEEPDRGHGTQQDRFDADRPVDPDPNPDKPIGEIPGPGQIVDRSDEAPDGEKSAVHREKKEPTPEQAVQQRAEAAEEAKKEKDTQAKGHLGFGDLKGLAKWQKRMLIIWFIVFIGAAAAFLVYACGNMVKASNQEEATWYQEGTDNASYTADNARAQELADQYGATHVLVGTYVETVNSVSIKNSQYVVTMSAWFRWEGDPDLDMAHHFSIYKGEIDNLVVVDDETVGDTHYQMCTFTATVNKVFYTSRFPLESAQLRLFVESGYTADRVIFEPDLDHSSINEGAYIAGYSIDDMDWGLTAHEYDNNESNPVIERAPVDSEYVTAITLRRTGFGLFFKCFIAMYGTTLWVLIMLYICGHHRVDPLGMIPGALFGTVSNIMVGAALLPDALDLGLLEYTNIWGVMTILACAIAIIQINNIRSEHGRQNEAFAQFFGRAMCYLITPIVIIGNLLLPLITFYG